MAHRAFRHAAAAAALSALAFAAPATAQDATGFVPGATAPAPLGGATSSLLVGTHPTALEGFLETPGRLLVERRARLEPIALSQGVVLRIEPVVAFEPTREQERMLGVRMFVDGTALADRDAVVYLDLHEVDGLVRGITLIPSLLEGEMPQPRGEIEIHHETLDGFVIQSTRRAGDVRSVLRIERPEVEAEIPVTSAALASLSEQLDASRRFLFEQ
jgi:hypothetical protein